MPKFKAKILSDNRDYTYENDIAIDMQGLDPKENHVQLEDSSVQSQPNTNIDTRITKLAFLNRFTADELAQLYTASEIDIAIKILERKLMAAEYIDLRSLMVSQALNLLLSSGILATSDRISEILSENILVEELFNG